MLIHVREPRRDLGFGCDGVLAVHRFGGVCDLKCRDRPINVAFELLRMGGFGGSSSALLGFDALVANKM